MYKLSMASIMPGHNTCGIGLHHATLTKLPPANCPFNNFIIATAAIFGYAIITATTIFANTNLYEFFNV